MTKQGGFSVVGLVVALVVIVALVVGGLYFFSDVFRGKIKDAWEGFAKWTPENIAKDPIGYLNFCEESTNKAVMKLKASSITIAQKKSEFVAKRDDLKKVLQSGTAGLKDLKDAYVKAEADKSFPLKWSTQTLDQEQAKKQIVRLNSEIAAKNGLMGRYDDGIKKLEVQAGKVQDATGKANEQLTTIQTTREQLKIKAITDDIKNQLVNMKAVLETDVLGVATESTGTISIDDLAAQSESKVSDEEFNKIMGVSGTK